MQKPLWLFLLALSILMAVSAPGVLAQGGAQKEEVLTNEQVVAMTKAGLSASIIVGKIQASKTNFDLSTEELMRLKREKVPDEVVSAMLSSKSASADSASRAGAGSTNIADPNDPSAAHDAGIYLFQDKDGQKQMTQLEPSVYSQAKSGGMWKSAMTYGIAKVKSKAVLASPNARLQLAQPRPVFYFYFEVKSSGLSGSGNPYSSASTSPNEFVLVKMEQKKNGRELTVGQFNAYGAQSGTLDKYAHAFDYEKIAPGVYKVTPRADLEEGEYGFFYGGTAPLAYYGYLGGASPKVFDFGVKRALSF